MKKFVCHHQVLNHQPLGYKEDTLDAAPRHCTDLPKFQDIQLNNKVMTIFINILSSCLRKIFVTPLQLHDHSSFLSGILGDMAKMQWHFFSQFSRQFQNKYLCNII